MATTAQISEAQAAEALGISLAELRAFRAKQAQRPQLVGKINQGDEAKFGAVTLTKVHPNGYSKHFGLSEEQAIAARDFLLEVYPLEG